MKKLWFKKKSHVHGSGLFAVQNIKKGMNVDGEEVIPFEYVPPKKLDISFLNEMKKTFINGLLDNLEWKEYGLGKREKTILPKTFQYFL